MRTQYAAAALLLAATLPASAASKKISYPPEMLGLWCLSKVEPNWLTYERGKCSGAVGSVILRANGDYVRLVEEEAEGVSIQQRCRALPHTYFKGWTDYICTTGEATGKPTTYKAGAPEKVTHKWATTGVADELMLAVQR
jgi:hypothetical protein